MKLLTECKPKDQCVTALPDQDVELLPGFINVMNNQGCCPSFQPICAPGTCPTPKPCPMYYKQINIDSHSCCPEFKCGMLNDYIFEILICIIQQCQVFFKQIIS